MINSPIANPVYSLNFQANLNYTSGSLSKLKSIFFQLRGKALQEGGNITVSEEEILNWIKEINQAEEQINKLLFGE